MTDMAVHESRVAAASAARRIRWITKLLTAIDFLAVAIVVPLLSSYFRDLDISTERYSLMSSAYSLAQLVGGLLLGAASDKSRRGVLLLSFFGSAVGYFLIGTARSFTVLLVSRVVVGLVKQTLTVCTALISENLDADQPGGRARELGHLSACATGSFVIGPVLGSLLYKQHRLLPPVVSASLFLLNSVLVLVLLPSSKSAAAATAAVNAADTEKLATSQNGSSSSGSSSSSGKSAKSLKERMYNLQRNLMGSCALRPCFVVVVAKLFNGFLIRSMDSSLIVGYFEDTWKVSCFLI
jgi:MFS family permease